MNSIKFRFEKPVHGWIKVHIITTRKDVCFDVSHTPSDTLRQLVVSLINVTSYGTKEKVEWFLEPECWTWSFIRNGNQIEFKTEELWNEYTEFEGDYLELVKSIYRGLRKLQVQDIWINQDNKHWTWEFPLKEMNILKSKIDEAKSK